MNYSDIYYRTYKDVRKKEKWLSPQEIKAVRKYFNLTQVDFADLLDVSYGTYKNWEIGYRIPSSPAMTLLYIARDYPEIFLKNKKKLA